MPRTRRRRSRHTRPWRRRLRTLLLGVAGVLVLVGVTGAVLARDAWNLREDLRQAETQLYAARDALAAGDIDAARSGLADGRARLTSARATTNRLLWRWGERVPAAGDTLRTVRTVVDAVEVTADVARSAVDRADVLLGGPIDRRIRAVAGQVPLEPLEAVAGELQDIDLTRLRQTRDRLVDLDLRWVPGEVREAQRTATETVTDALATVERAQALTAVLPEFLGAGEPRRYFLAMQNPAEIRGTGGFLGFFSVLSVDDGQFSLTRPQVYAALNEDTDVTVEVAETDAPPDFQARYGQANAAGFLANVNLDPDLPTVAPLVLDLYRRTAGARLDGVIIVDPIALERALLPIGAVRVADDVADPTGRIPNPLPPEQLTETTTSIVYDAFGGRSEARKEYLRAVATEAFDRIFSGTWDGVEMARALADGATTGHIQFYSTDEDEQRVFEDTGVAGALGPREGHDLLAVTANNTAANKMDVHVGHRITGTIRLVGDNPEEMRRLTDLSLAVENPLPTSGHDPYIIGSWLPRGEGGPFAGPRGLNRTWFSVWAPPDAVLLPSDSETDGGNASSMPMHGLRAVDVELETPSGTVASVDVSLSSSATVVEEAGGVVYRLRLEHQPKAIPDRLDLEVVAPSGWRVVMAGLDGGGDGRGSGVYGEPGPPLQVEALDEQTVRVYGDADRDAILEVWLARA